MIHQMDDKTDMAIGCSARQVYMYMVHMIIANRTK